MRTTNLIQSYVNNSPATRQYNSDKAVKDFDVKKELSNRTFIKPLPSNGKLVKVGPFEVMSEFRKDIKYDMKALAHAAKGEANDHELGRLNDVGMKVGGLAIAAYLATKKATPMTKAFEFIGLASFFAAMDLWPKLFIQLPAKLVHGVDVRQQYEDNYGRKKMFYQDHQFIPWDLYSDKEIDKIGDRLNVPKNIPNRREFIQEKMRKIALQNNTLWMLTAGFATPVMSALICNGLEGPVKKFLAYRTDKKADALMTNFAQEIKKYDFSKNTRELEKILADNAGKPMTPEILDAIRANITDGLDHMVSVGIEKDLHRMFSVGERFNFSSSNIEGVQETLKKTLAPSGLSEEQLTKLIPDADTISKALEQKGLLNGNFKEFSEHSKVVQNILAGNIQQFIAENPTAPEVKKLNFLMKKLVHSTEYGADSVLAGAFKSTSSSVLTDDTIRLLKDVSAELNDLKAKTVVLHKFAFMKAAQAPETSLADSWGEITETIMKSLNFSPEEIQKARLDREFAGTVLRNKLEAITLNQETYGKFLEDVEKVLSSLQSRIEPLDMTQDASKNKYKAAVITTFDDSAANLRKFGLKSTSEALVGFPQTAHTSTKELYFNFLTNRVKGVTSSIYRFIDLADVYYKVANVSGLDHVLHGGVPREVKEEMVELAKQMLLEGHTSDFSVKFWQKRNPAPDRSDTSQIETAMGKVVNKYFGKRETTELAELVHDREYFDGVMKLMFGGDVHPVTHSKLKDAIFFKDFMNYREQALKILGGDYCFTRPNCLVNGKRVDSTSQFRFLLMGAAPDEIILKMANQKFNSGKWFSLFGKLGAGLVGVTLLAQLFFGRMKTPKPAKETK